MKVSLHGTWTADIGDGKSYSLQLPGTLDENRIGHKDTGANQWHPDVALGNEDKRPIRAFSAWRRHEARRGMGMRWISLSAG